MRTTSPLQNRPKYRQIEEWVRARIESGELTGGDKLPAEQDLAREFGVAYMTVRSAINELVAQGYLQRIHGKGTFVMARPAPSTVSTMIMVVPSLELFWNVPNLYFFPAIIQGFCSEATRLGYEPSLMAWTTETRAFLAQESSGVAGVACLLVWERDAEVLETLRDSSLPTVGINSYRGRRNISFVTLDQAGAMSQAVQLLIDKGHRNIVFLPGPQNNYSATERERGYRKAMTHAGLPVRVEANGQRDYSESSGHSRALQLLRAQERPTAIVSAGDLVAAGVLQAARELDIAVPEQLSVVGFADAHLASQMQPPLTTVHLPLVEMGVEAAALLHRQVGGARRERITLPGEVVQRSSVSEPPATSE